MNVKGGFSRRMSGKGTRKGRKEQNIEGFVCVYLSIYLSIYLSVYPSMLFGDSIMKPNTVCLKRGEGQKWSKECKYTICIYGIIRMNPTSTIYIYGHLKVKLNFFFLYIILFC
jgi:hypothetical protein